MATNTPDDVRLRSELATLLHGGKAHAPFVDAVADFPAEHRSMVLGNAPYSAWQLLEHLRIAQRDILDFCSPPTGGYQPMEWPRAYWPEKPAPPHGGSWDAAVAAIQSDLATFLAMIADPKNDLHNPFRWGEGQTLLREALLIADHTSYHVGEMVLLRRMLGIWGPQS